MAEPIMPMLSLTPEVPDPEPEKEQHSIQETKPAEPETKYEAPNLDNSQLTDAERRAIEDFIGKLDVTNPDHVLLFGAEAQKKVAAFSDTALDAVKTQETGEVGQMLGKLVTELKGFDADAEPKGLRRLFSKPVDAMERMKAQYSKVNTNVENIADSLENYQAQLLKDVAMFDRLYDQNSRYFRELTLYIIAGDEYLRRIRGSARKVPTAPPS